MKEWTLLGKKSNKQQSREVAKSFIEDFTQPVHLSDQSRLLISQQKDFLKDHND
jgi:hypothetical protein